MEKEYQGGNQLIQVHQRKSCQNGVCMHLYFRWKLSSLCDDNVVC